MSSSHIRNSPKADDRSATQSATSEVTIWMIAGFEEGVYDPACEAAGYTECPVIHEPITVNYCTYGSYKGCNEASTRTWQLCRGEPGDCSKFGFEESEFCNFY